jgi:hypothetical protein
MERVLCQVYNPALSAVFLELRIPRSYGPRFSELRILRELRDRRL